MATSGDHQSEKDPSTDSSIIKYQKSQGRRMSSGVHSQSSIESEMNEVRHLLRETSLVFEPKLSGAELCEWYTYVLEKERGSHKYGLIEEEPENPSASGGAPPPPHSEEQKKEMARMTSDDAAVTSEITTPLEDGRVVTKECECCCVIKETKDVFLLTSKRPDAGVGIVIEKLSGPPEPPSAENRVAIDFSGYTADAENYFATITVKDEHGVDKEVPRLLEVRYCSAGESCDDFDLAEPTPELINKDPEAKLKVCRDGSKPKPGHDTGQWCTESNVFVGVDTVKCEPVTFSKPPPDSRRYLLAVTINICLLCNPKAPIAIYWAGSRNRNYYLTPRQEDQDWKVCVEQDKRENLRSYRLWSNTYHNTGQ